MYTDLRWFNNEAKVVMNMFFNSLGVVVKLVDSFYTDIVNGCFAKTIIEFMLIVKVILDKVGK